MEQEKENLEGALFCFLLLNILAKNLYFYFMLQWEYLIISISYLEIFVYIHIIFHFEIF